MGDSEDEYERQRRDKFQRERSDQYERRGHERDWSRERYKIDTISARYSGAI